MPKIRLNFIYLQLRVSQGLQWYNQCSPQGNPRGVHNKATADHCWFPQKPPEPQEQLPPWSSHITSWPCWHGRCWGFCTSSYRREGTSITPQPLVPGETLPLACGPLPADSSLQLTTGFCIPVWLVSHSKGHKGLLLQGPPKLPTANAHAFYTTDCPCSGHFCYTQTTKQQMVMTKACAKWRNQLMW